MFDSKVSQSTLTKEFAVAEKKIHLAVSCRKYNPDKKTPKPKTHVKSSTQKKKSAKPDESKMDKKKTEFQKTGKLHQKILINPSLMMSTTKMTMIHCQTHLHPKKRTKMSGTKEDQGAEDTQAEMNTMPELISSDDNDAPPKSFDTKNPAGIPRMPHHLPKKFTTKNLPPQPHHK